MAVALGILLLVAGIGGWWYQTQQAREKAAGALPQPPSIAVLPFQDLSDEGQLGRFANSLASDIIADLSASRILTVIAPRTSLSST